MTNSKLINMYKAYDELADTFDKIREKDKVIDTRDIANIVDMIHNDECRNCSMRRRCWDLNFSHTYMLMSQVLEELEDNGQVTIESISEDFRKECLKPEEIVKIANYYYKLFLVDYNWSLRFSESRKLIANQIKSISKSSSLLNSSKALPPLSASFTMQSGFTSKIWLISSFLAGRSSSTTAIFICFLLFFWLFPFSSVILHVLLLVCQKKRRHLLVYSEAEGHFHFRKCSLNARVHS